MDAGDDFETKFAEMKDLLTEASSLTKRFSNYEIYDLITEEIQSCDRKQKDKHNSLIIKNEIKIRLLDM